MLTEMWSILSYDIHNGINNHGRKKCSIFMSQPVQTASNGYQTEEFSAQ